LHRGKRKGIEEASCKGKDIEQDAPTNLRRSLHRIKEGTETVWFLRKPLGFYENRRDFLFFHDFQNFDEFLGRVLLNF
jgi:hypothetical protein